MSETSESTPVQPFSFNGFGAPRPEIKVGRANPRGKRLVIGHIGEKEYRDEINIDRADERQKFLKGFATKMELPKDSFRFLDDELLRKCTAFDAEQHVATTEEAPQASEPALTVSPEVQAEAEALLNSADLERDLLADFATLGIVAEDLLALAVFFICVSRLLPHPLSGCVQSASGSGKSFVTEAVLSLFPESTRIMATAISDQALYYLEEGALKNKILFRSERQHADPRNSAATANSGLAVREMQSSGQLRKLVTARDPDGNLVTRHIVQEGPIAFLETTTEEEIFSEDATRSLPLATDESVAQTERIQRLQQLEAMGATADEHRQDQVRQKHHAAQERLADLKVTVPFAEHLSLPVSKVASRRVYPQLITLIKSIALFRQFLKPIHNGTIEADLNDYCLARKVYLPILERQFAPLSERARSMYEAIHAHVSQMNQMLPRTFTRKEVETWCGIGTTETRKRMNALVEAGLISEASGARGVAYRYRIDSSPSSFALEALPTVEELQRRIAGGESHLA
jgi:hypothetical protein